VRLFDPEYTDIKVHWAPHRYPYTKMIKIFEETVKFISRKNFKTAFTTVEESISYVPKI